MTPSEADFGVTIDFRRGESDPVKIFGSMRLLLTSFQQFDRVATFALDPKIEPIMVLADIEANSITTWFKNTLNQVDDQALKELDWKQQIGKYLVKAKYMIIEHLDSREETAKLDRLKILRDDLFALSQQTISHGGLLLMPINMEQLVAPMDQIQDAKRLLSHKERLTIKSKGKEHTLDLSSTAKPGDLLKVPEICRTDEGTMPMTLLVRKPDLLGSTMWEFRHGGNSVSARISDTDWLSSFHAGQETIHPGSALTCTVHYSYGYDAAGELQSVKHEVVKVHNVINPSTGRQLRIDDT